jgi:hypothetical protein
MFTSGVGARPDIGAMQDVAQQSNPVTKKIVDGGKKDDVVLSDIARQMAARQEGATMPGNAPAEVQASQAKVSQARPEEKGELYQESERARTEASQPDSGESADTREPMVEGDLPPRLKEIQLPPRQSPEKLPIRQEAEPLPPGRKRLDLLG